MRSGAIFSAILHALMLAVIFLGLPSFFEKKKLEDHAIIVELLPISNVTNVKKRLVKPKYKPKPKKEAISQIKKPAMKQPKVKPEVTSKPKPKKKKVVKIKDKIKVAEVKPLQKPKVKKEVPKTKEKKDEVLEDSFGAVLNTIEEIQQKEENKVKEKEVDFSDIEDLLSNVDDQPKYKPGLPLSISDKDEIKRQIMNNWTVLSGAKDAKEMLVTLRIKLSAEGEVTDIDIENKIRYNTDPFYQAMVDSAVRAVYKTSPLKGLPQEKYMVKNGWQEMEINFNPSEMMY